MEQFPTPEIQETNRIETLRAEIAEKRTEMVEIIESLGGIEALDQEALAQLARIQNLSEKIAA